MERGLLLPERPYTSLDEYVAAGGGAALRAVLDGGGDGVLDALDRSGLRGRGGAGFPAARKWRSVMTGGAELGDRYVVANGAEGEPGTFKDRALLRANPYQVIEGLCIAAHLIGAARRSSRSRRASRPRSPPSSARSGRWRRPAWSPRSR